MPPREHADIKRRQYATCTSSGEHRNRFILQTSIFFLSLCTLNNVPHCSSVAGPVLSQRQGLLRLLLCTGPCSPSTSSEPASCQTIEWGTVSKLVALVSLSNYYYAAPQNSDATRDATHCLVKHTAQEGSLFPTPSCHPPSSQAASNSSSPPTMFPATRNGRQQALRALLFLVLVSVCFSISFHTDVPISTFPSAWWTARYLLSANAEPGYPVKSNFTTFLAHEPGFSVIENL